MKLTFQKETFAKIMKEMLPVLVAHFNETPDGELDPDWQKYIQMEVVGALHIITARDKGRLVGYWFSLIQNHLHDRKLRVAYTDLWYILPEYRPSGNGVRLIKAGEKMLKDLGVKRNSLSIPVSSNIPFLPAGFGYTLSEKSYRKEL